MTNFGNVLRDLLDNSAGNVQLVFPDEGIETSLGSLWDAGRSLASWNMATGPGLIAMLLTNRSPSVTCLLGAIRGGISVVSLPLPTRGSGLDWFQRFVCRVCARLGCQRLLVDSTLLPLLPAMSGIRVFSFEEVLAWQPHDSEEQRPFRLVQFTSGSTADPKGVDLDDARICSNISAILQRLQPESGDGFCSWLPISHDLGLIGAMLSTMVAGGQPWTSGTQLILLRPETFLRRPAIWMQACSHYAATTTASPNFGFEIALRRMPSMPPDLSNLRICITGGEPVRANVLEKFGEALASAGFSSLVFCPGYGMAEAALAVSMTAPDEHVRSISVKADDAFSDATRSKDLVLVSAGSPLRGYTVESLGPGIGELVVSGPSLIENYSDGTAALDADGRFHTHDLGLVQDGHVYVLGRTDDMIIVAGRNIYACDIDDAVGSVQGVRIGRSVAIRDADGSLIVAAEVDGPHDGDSIETLTRDIRQAVNERVGITPQRVHLLHRDSLPPTSSGKIRRAAAHLAVNQGSLNEALESRERRAESGGVVEKT